MFLPQARERRNREASGRSNRSQSHYGIPAVPRLDNPGGGDGLPAAGTVDEKTEPPGVPASTLIDPPCRSTIRCTVERSIPSPSHSVRTWSRRNGS